MDNALKLEGIVRHVSVHACAVVIAPESLYKYTALQHPPKDDTGIITQFSAKPLEALGLLKMDFLGLKNLTILQTTLKIIERTTGDIIRLATIPMDDKKAFALLSRGETTGVFQLESAGMKRYLRELKPTEFEDIIAMVSLYRPGPMEWIPDYIAGKHGRKEIKYLHPSLEPILKTTYGIAIYQEQILQIAQEFAGFSLGEADLLRRAIGKKIASELESQRELFIEGAKGKGIDASLAITIFEKVIEPFAGYGFNKSHAACYAMIAYQTAYLKAHYPTQFMTALMSADYGNTDRIVIEINECEQMGIQVLPPDVNESLSNFTFVESGKIRFGLSAIKGLGAASVQHIIDARAQGGAFKSLEDFAARCPSKIMNKKTLEALAYAGAMDSLGERRQIALNYEVIADFSKHSDGSVHLEQAGLFDQLSEVPEFDLLALEPVEPATFSERLKWEKETLGLYVSSHPLAGLELYFQRKVIPSTQLLGKSMGKPVKIGGLIQSLRKIVTKKGDVMALLQLEDPFGKIDCVLFPKAYKKYSSVLMEDRVMLAGGFLERRMGEAQVVIEDLEILDLEALQQKPSRNNYGPMIKIVASLARNAKKRK
ncbi:DNA polymerase III subunit alpha [Candidatus Peregrinibacteria bacterium]|nr:MAG: DNA polymerase III subunit alpha [Candidatus Peregrinibacteria bacterium]